MAATHATRFTAKEYLALEAVADESSSTCTASIASFRASADRVMENYLIRMRVSAVERARAGSSGMPGARQATKPSGRTRTAPDGDRP